MTRLRTGEPWMPAPDYGRSLTGLGINLLVREIESALPFHTEVLGAEVVYSDADIAVLRRDGMEWMLHAHHTYDAHPWYPILTSDVPRGVGAELRLHGRDPDAAEAAAPASRIRDRPGRRRQAPRPARVVHRRPRRLRVGAGRSHPVANLSLVERMAPRRWSRRAPLRSR